MAIAGRGPPHVPRTLLSPRKLLRNQKPILTQLASMDILAKRDHSAVCVAEATCGDALPASIPSLAVFVFGLVPNGSLGMIGSNVLRSEQLEFTWGLLCMSQDMLWGVCMCKHMQCGKVPFLYQDLRTSSLECNGKRARATLQAFVAVLMLCKLSSCLSFSHVSSSLSCPSFPSFASCQAV